MPSATPNAQAASTLPPTYLIFVRSFDVSSAPSSFAKNCCVKAVKLVTTCLPINCRASVMSPFCGTCT